jgi:toxin ParE1/3/4
MTHSVVYSRKVLEQLERLELYIAEAATPATAERYIDSIVAYCESLATFPMRGICRDDIQPCLRVTHYKSRTVIVFGVDTTRVSIAGVFYGGQNYEVVFQED